MSIFFTIFTIFSFSIFIYTTEAENNEYKFITKYNEFLKSSIENTNCSFNEVFLYSVWFKLSNFIIAPTSRNLSLEEDYLSRKCKTELKNASN